MTVWATEILNGSIACAELLDKTHADGVYLAAVKNQFTKLSNPELTPSAQVLRDMTEHQQSFYVHTIALAEQHRVYFEQRPLSENDQAHFNALTQKSLHEQQALEKQQQPSFDDYLANYYAQYRGCSCGNTTSAPQNY